MSHPAWWCVRCIACQGLELTPARVDARPPRPQGGLASWYGPGLYGRPMVSGEPCSRHELTAAYCTLPLNIQMLVHHLAIEAQVEGKILDRGPYMDPRPGMDIP